MDSTDWQSLGREASVLRKKVWDSMIENMQLRKEEIPLCAARIGQAYIDLRIDFDRARLLLSQDRAPSPQDLDPPLAMSSDENSSFKKTVLECFETISQSCIADGTDPDDIPTAMAKAEELIAQSAMPHPLA